MSSNIRTMDLEKRTLRGASIAAGISYLYGILYGVLVGLPISSALIVSGNAAATSANIVSREFLYRVNNLAELIMYASVVVLAVALFIITRSVGRNLSLVALALRLVEAGLSCVLVLAGYAALEFLNGQAHLSAFTAEQRQALVQALLNIRIAGGRVTPLFFCTGSII
jgi:hypothetical protein